VGSVDDNMSGGAYAYRASKSALNIITKSLFCDLAGSVAVLLLHPGYVRTDMTGGQGLIDVDESVSGMLKAIEATDGSSPFRWVDFKACRIPW
jgi:NAD(P)-dependent dehydrogenase (short-subunit alcohol dehydrogenase family)